MFDSESLCLADSVAEIAGVASGWLITKAS